MSFSGTVLSLIVLMNAVGCFGCWWIWRLLKEPAFVARHPWANGLKARFDHLKERFFPTLDNESEIDVADEPTKTAVINATEGKNAGRHTDAIAEAARARAIHSPPAEAEECQANRRTSQFADEGQHGERRLGSTPEETEVPRSELNDLREPLGTSVDRVLQNEDAGPLDPATRRTAFENPDLVSPPSRSFSTAPADDQTSFAAKNANPISNPQTDATNRRVAVENSSLNNEFAPRSNNSPEMLVAQRPSSAVANGTSSALPGRVGATDDVRTEIPSNADTWALFAAGGTTSQLTLSDQQAFDEQSEKAIKRWRSDRENFSIMLFKLDSLESTREPNDVEREQLIRWFQQRICQGIASNSDQAVARVRGDELIALVAKTDLDDSKRLAEKIRRNFVRTPCKLDGRPVPATLCAGVAATNVADDDDASQVVPRAELALAAARQGRNQVYFHDGERCRPMWRTGGNADEQDNSLADELSREEVPQELVGAGSAAERSSNSCSFERGSDRPGTNVNVNAVSASAENADFDDPSEEPSVFDEKRQSTRAVLGQMIPIAPYSDGAVPEPGEFRLFLCRDISLTGFSFYARPAPTWSHLVVKLLGKSLIAKIVHRTRAVREGRENTFIVGCCFVGQMDLADGRTSAK